MPENKSLQTFFNRREMHASEPEVAPAVSKCTDTFAVRSTDLRRSSMQLQTQRSTPARAKARAVRGAGAEPLPAGGPRYPLTSSFALAFLPTSTLSFVRLRRASMGFWASSKR